MMKSKELRALELTELQEKLAEGQKNLYLLRVKATTKELDKVGQIREQRKDIARILQAIGEKKAAAQA